MLPTGLCNIGHCALTPISRSDITSVFSFDNHQKTPFCDVLWAEIDKIKIVFFLKSGTLIFVLLGIITADGYFHFGFALPSLWVRSGFAPKSGDKEYSKWDEKAPNHHLSIFRKNQYNSSDSCNSCSKDIIGDFL